MTISTKKCYPTSEMSQTFNIRGRRALWERRNTGFKKVILDVLKGILGKARAVEGLRDKRRSNYRKLTEKDEKQIVQCKIEGKHRSARFIRDRLRLLCTSRRYGGFWSSIISIVSLFLR